MSVCRAKIYVVKALYHMGKCSKQWMVACKTGFIEHKWEPSAYILLSVTSLTWIIIMLFAKPFILMFNQDAELLNIGVKSMHIYFFGFFMMTFQFIGQITFTALGRSKKAIFFSLLRKVFIVIPLTFILPMAIGVDGVFYAEPISNFIGGTACCLTMYLTEYKKL